MLAAADQRLSEVRRHVPDAGGMVIATNRTQARAYAAMLRQISGEAPTVVLSDDPKASASIETYAASQARWMVAVRMVSEGVDVPRLAVGVYATSTSTPLFFAQAVGRFVRARRRGETASVFLPSVPVILEHASRLEDERDHALDRVVAAETTWSPEEDLLAEANATRSTADLAEDQPGFEALESDAQFDHVLFDAEQYGFASAAGSADEADYLGLPGLLEPDQVAHLLAEKQRRHAGRVGGRRAAEPAVTGHRALAGTRKELNSLVAAYARKTGQPHAVVHAELRRHCGGPTLDQATHEQVSARIEKIRAWFVGRR